MIPFFLSFSFAWYRAKSLIFVCFPQAFYKLVRQHTQGHYLCSVYRLHFLLPVCCFHWRKHAIADVVFLIYWANGKKNSRTKDAIKSTRNKQPKNIEYFLHILTNSQSKIKWVPFLCCFVVIFFRSYTCVRRIYTYMHVCRTPIYRQIEFHHKILLFSN